MKHPPSMRAFEAQPRRSRPLKYLIYTPDSYRVNPDQLFPLVVFLHGGGQSGTDLNRVCEMGIPRKICEGAEFPFLMLAPQNPHTSRLWDHCSVMGLVDQVAADHRVDPDRISLTGLSRGGLCAWELAMNHPDRFAALAVVCGASAPSVYAGWIKHLPIWVFHGARDPIVPISIAENMVASLRSVGADVRFTVYPEVGHEAWEQAYADPELYTWLMSHSLKSGAPGG